MTRWQDLGTRTREVR